MSYDVVIFDMSVAPVLKVNFEHWVNKQISLSKSKINLQSVSSYPPLEKWYKEMLYTFPQLKLSDLHSEAKLHNLSDYMFGTNCIYCSFSQGIASLSYDEALRLALKYKLGILEINQLN